MLNVGSGIPTTFGLSAGVVQRESELGVATVENLILLSEVLQLRHPAF